MTPQQKQLAALLRKGPIHSADLRYHHGIGDPGRRRNDLMELGWVIDSKIQRRNGAHGTLYTLVSEPPAGFVPEHSKPTRELQAVTGPEGTPIYPVPPFSRVHPPAALGEDYEKVIVLGPNDPNTGVVYWQKRDHTTPTIEVDEFMDAFEKAVA